MGAPTSATPLRVDARRNMDRIRAAALEVFRERGLGVPLEDVAAEAGVSKATIFNRFGGRVGLIETVIDELVLSELKAVIDDVRSLDAVQGRIALYLNAIRDMQYRTPAVNEVLLQGYPHSEQLMSICHLAEGINDELVDDGHAAGVLVDGFTANDLHALIVDNALALTHGERPARADYDRRGAFLLRGIMRQDSVAATTRGRKS